MHMVKTVEKAEVEKRVLEAEKVVVSNILFNWRRKYGMDYILMVRNGPGDVFSRTNVSAENWNEMAIAVQEVQQELVRSSVPGAFTQEQVMVIRDRTEPIDLMTCFYSFRPIKGQTVGDWCRRWGYRLEGNNEKLKTLFQDTVVKTGEVFLSDLSMTGDRIDRVEDCFFE
jgi:hypothetical protein